MQKIQRDIFSNQLNNHQKSIIYNLYLENVEKKCFYDFHFEDFHFDNCGYFY